MTVKKFDDSAGERIKLPSAKSLLYLIPTPLLLMAPSAYGQPIEQSPQPMDVRKNSINIDPLSWIVGAASVSYERMLDHHHASLVHIGGNSVDFFNTRTKGAFGLLGYRYHWSGGQDSGFYGVSVSHRQSQTSVSELDGVAGDVGFDTALTSLTANVGRRWAWDNGLNITLRGGLGYGNYKISSEAPKDDLDKAVDVAEPFSKASIAIESELTIGYCF